MRRRGHGHFLTLPEGFGFLPEPQWIMLCNMASKSEANSKPKQRRSRWVILLVLPYLGLCFPQIYAHSTPTLLGFPFFYWYQFAWVIGAAALLGIVYLKLRN
jgi:hypothetical protein